MSDDSPSLEQEISELEALFDRTRDAEASLHFLCKTALELIQRVRKLEGEKRHLKRQIEAMRREAL